MIKRLQLEYALNRLFKGKALIIYGPRQAGKTTFTEQILAQVEKRVLRLNGDDADIREMLASTNEEVLRNLIGKNEIVFIDEAQRITEIGILIKIIVDRVKGVQVIATGSSSFELAGGLNEPLTGRKYEVQLLPLSYGELINHSDFLTEMRQLEQRLIYGSYPEIVTNPEMAEEHLKLLTESYLFKDLFKLDSINRPQLFDRLVKALALQVGNEVSITEVGRTIGVDNKTVEKYLALLEKAYVVFVLPAFARNVRNEIRKGRKIYFYDNGIINAIIGNFRPLNQRTDVGALWENYMVSERIKFLSISQQQAKLYFWRTTQQQEIDLIEERYGSLAAFEFKYSENKKVTLPKTFLRAYPDAKTHIIKPKEQHKFLTETL